ncbi:MAG: InlB B-repeat-containing protein [Treponema sp.]|nr:InlB B-repeat-containing protein [Treponema sp.]
MKHTNMIKKLVKSTVLLGTVFAFLGLASCNNELSLSKPKSGKKAKTYLVISDVSCRAITTLTPDEEANKLLLTNVELKGSTTETGTKITLAGGSGKSLADIANKPVLIDPGTWYLTLYADLNGVTFSANKNLTITAGSTANIVFTLATSDTSANGINITVSFNDKDAPDSEVTKVVATLKSEDKATTHATDAITTFEAAGTGTRKVTYNKTSLDGGATRIPAGTYYLELEFFAGDATNGYVSINSPIPAFVGVVDGMCTTAEWNIALNDVYSITYNTNGGTFQGFAPLKFTSKYAVTLPQMSKPGYYFAGWYTDSLLEDGPVTSIPQNTKQSKEFYAKFTQINLGDVLLNDGSYVSYSTITEEQVNNAVGVVYGFDQDNEVMGVVGLKNTNGGSWATYNTTGYSTKFESIICTPVPDNSNASTATFTGDTDGSDNWAYICAIDTEGTTDAQTNYPAFDSVNEYATTVGLTGSYASGWYIPSIAELCTIYNNNEVINNALAAIKAVKNDAAATITSYYLWSSSQVNGSVGNGAWYINFGSGDIFSSNKDWDSPSVVCVRSVKPAPDYGVIFHTSGGSAVATQKVASGQKAVEPTGSDIPTKDGYTFAGWYTSTDGGTTLSDTTFDFDTPITEHTVLFAKWNIKAGALLLKDGTYVLYSDSPSFTSEQVQNAVGIVYDVDQTTGEPRGVMGLKNAKKVWAPANTTGNETVFEDIVVRTSLSMPDEGIPYFVYDWSHFGVTEPKYARGDLDGSDNWAYVCSTDPIGAADAATNYPAFDYANNYGTATATNLTGTDYENGWYMPSIVELWYVFNNKAILNNVISALNTAQADSADVIPDAYGDNFMSSSQNSQAIYVYHINFGADTGGDFIGGFKDDDNALICCVRKIKALPDYAVVFNTNGVSQVTTQIVPSGQKATEPTVSDYGNRTFEGWYTDSLFTTEFDFNTPITSHTVLYAKWNNSVGDLLLKNGTIVPYNANSPFTTKQIQDAVGIVVEFDNTGSPKTVLGLKNIDKNSTGLAWATDNTTGYNTKFNDIISTVDPDFSSTSTSTIVDIQSVSGDSDGSDNWRAISTTDSTGVAEAATNYPAFNYANNYGSTYLAGTSYDLLWYIPSFAELCNLYRNYSRISEVISAINSVTNGAADALTAGQYWSSSQAEEGSSTMYALSANVVSGSVKKSDKSSQNQVCCLRSVIPNYTVTFNTNGGSPIASQALLSGQLATQPSTDPTLIGDTFDGWYTVQNPGPSDSEFNFATPITSNITLYAKWQNFVYVPGRHINSAVGNSTVLYGNRKYIIIDDMLVCDHEVTQAEYEQYCTYNSTSPSSQYGDGDNFPVYYVTWYDAIIYCNLRSKAENLQPVYYLADERGWEVENGREVSTWASNPAMKISMDGNGFYYSTNTSSNSLLDYSESDESNNDPDGGILFDYEANGYRLPTEAEWEYIARGGSRLSAEKYSGTDDTDELTDYAWYSGNNTTNKTHEVKGKNPNSLGIYDMSGNVIEWCWDWYADTLVSGTPDEGPESGTNRVRRGGAYNNPAENCQVDTRNSSTPETKNYQIGFRVVRTVVDED